MQGDSPRAGHSDYLDFDLEIGIGTGREYPVTVLHSPAGKVRETMHFPFDELALENRLLNLQNVLLRSGGKHRRVPTNEEQAVQDFGQALFDTLFSGEIRSYYDMSQREATHQDKGLRLKLSVRPPKLNALPWEFMYDPRQAEYVCLSRQTPIVRYLESPRLIRPLTVTPPLRILGMVASPTDLPTLDVKRERQRVEQALQGLRARGLVELEWLPGQTWRDLQEATWGGPWHVFHFVGHGGFDANADEGFIALAGRAGETHRLTATLLGRLLADHKHLRLVLLNSCEGARGGERDVFSSTASILVRRGIPAVLAMQYEVTDRAAIELARAFYRALAYGMAVDEAVVAARQAISLAVTNTVEWGTPVLYTRALDGVLFQVAGVPRVDRPPAEEAGPPPEAEKEQEQRLEQLYVDGLAAFWVEEWDEARRCFGAIVDQRPGYRDSDARLQEAERQGKLARLYAQAQAARETGDWPGALAALEELVAGAPDFRDAAALLEMVKRRARLADLYAQAQHLSQAGQWQAVVNVFARIAPLDPAYPDPDELLPAAERGIAEQKKQEKLNDLYSHALREMNAGQWARARDLLAQVQEMEAGYRETERLLARTEAEIAERERQAELNELYEQAQAAREAGDWAGAVSALEKLVAEVPEFHGAADMLDELKRAAPTLGEMRLFGGVEMVYVLAGKFWMGNDDSDTATRDDEKPRHEVFVEGFWIDRTPVTNKEYWRFVEAAGHKKPEHWKGGRIPEGKEDHPVVCVRWHDAQAYCRWRGEQAGVASCLPTEAEWEKAARGTDGRRYPWGDEFDQDKCNSRKGGPGDTTPVGRYSPQGDSPCGCVDMAGNVWEWTSSLVKPYPYDAGDGREDPDASGFRVLRGGSWFDVQSGARCAYRGSSHPDDFCIDLGFRVVVAPTLPS